MVILNILQAWVNNKRCVVSAESYFSLVQACEDLKKRGLRFICMSKKATRGFCMEIFFEIELAWRVLRKDYFSLDNNNKLEKFSLVWVYRDRWYFIPNTSSLKPGMQYSRYRLRQLDDSVEFEINQPRVAER